MLKILRIISVLLVAAALTGAVALWSLVGSAAALGTGEYVSVADALTVTRCGYHMWNVSFLEYSFALNTSVVSEIADLAERIVRANRIYLPVI